MKRDFIITELLLYPYPEIKDAVSQLRSSNELLTADDIRYVLTQTETALAQHDEPEAPLSALRHLTERLHTQLSQLKE